MDPMRRDPGRMPVPKPPSNKRTSLPVSYTTQNRVATAANREGLSIKDFLEKELSYLPVTPVDPESA